MTKIRLMLALLACVFAAATIAAIGQGHDLESVAMSAVPSVILAAAWYFIGWIEFRR